jgi:hypothetical protein
VASDNAGLSDEACPDVSDEFWASRSRKLAGVSDDGAKSSSAGSNAGSAGSDQRSVIGS